MVTPIVSQTSFTPPAEPAAPPAPTAPAPPPAPAPPSKMAVNPIIDASGRRVNPLGQPVKDSGVVDMGDSMDDFMSGVSNKTPIDSDDATAPAPAPAPDAAKKSDDSVPESSPFEQPATQVAQPSVAKRDYSQLPPEIAAIAKKLPNAVYEHLIKTHKQFEDDIAAERARIVDLTKERDAASVKATFDHPEAFQIDPEYRTVVLNYGHVETELNHYTDQLAAIEAGEAWTIITGYDAAGQPQYREVPASPDGRVDYKAKARLAAAMNELTGQRQVLRQQAAQIQERYKNAAAEVQQHYTNARQRLFKDLDPTKLTDEAEKNAFKFAIEALPYTEQRRPSAEMLGLAAVSVVRMGKRLQEALTELERMKRVGATARAAAPVRVANQPAILTDESDDEVDFSNPLSLPPEAR